MNRLLLLVFLSIALCSYVSGQGHNKLSRKERRQGWFLLFDGISTTGWHTFRKAEAGQAWRVEGGVLKLDPGGYKGRGDLVTDQEFSDFELMFDWNLAARGNSGVIFMVQDRAPYLATWHTGPEYQLIDNEGYPSKLSDRQYSGSLYDLVACPPELAKPAGQWNHSSIKLHRDRLIFHLNGKKVVDTRIWNNDWKKMVSKSKFNKENDFVKVKKGNIAIQDHGGEIQFRNIKARHL